MSLQNEFNELESGHWSEIDPFLCPCHGSGWLLSNLDTEHKCGYHYKEGVPCRESYEYAEGIELDNLSKLAKDNFEDQCLKAIKFYLEPFLNKNEILKKLVTLAREENKIYLENLEKEIYYTEGYIGRELTAEERKNPQIAVEKFDKLIKKQAEEYEKWMKENE